MAIITENLPVYAVVRLDKGKRRFGVTRDGVLVDVEARRKTAERTVASINGFRELMGKESAFDSLYQDRTVVWNEYQHSYQSVSGSAVAA